MGCVKLFDNNYADPELYANLFYSSQQTNFPASNMLAKVRRSKVWRSNGYWNVTASNNTLVFRDISGGSNITATIAVGEYTTTTSFMTAVDTALEAVGAANYTITQNSNLKFVITSDLSGGATHFELKFDDAGNTCESLLGFSNVHYTGASSYTSDFLRINTNERITFDLGLPTNISDFALTGFRNRALKLSPTGIYRIEGNTTSNFSSPEFSQTLTYNSNNLVAFSDAGLHTGPLRYWSVYLEDQNPLGFLEIGSIFMGDSYSPTRGKAQFPFKTKFIDRSSTIFSEGGQSFTELQQLPQDFSVEWKALTSSEAEELSSIFEVYGVGVPLFVAFDSESAFSSSENYFLRYVKFADEPVFDLISPNNFSCSMSFREEL